jgi:ferric-dicitrate binding protein FerR (iron transport regulator)
VGNQGRDEDDETTVAALLRAAGPRERPPADAEAAVRAAVHAEWSATVAARGGARRRRWAAAMLAAASAAVAVGVGLLSPVPRTPVADPTVATVVSARDLRTSAGPVAAGAPLARETLLVAAPGGGAVLAWNGGAQLRVAGGSELRLGENRVVLERGAVYLDGDATRVAPFVETSQGLVRHLGTRYAVRVIDDGLRIDVRDGRVAFDGGAGAVVATAGERLAVDGRGVAVRSPVPTYGADWAWSDALAPGFEIDGRRLAEFVEWAARESGRRVRYATPAAGSAAGELVLKGSIEGLPPDLALRAVLATTRFESRTDGAELVVDLRDAGRGGVR